MNEKKFVVIKHPTVGSGKIKRRVRITSYRKRNRKPSKLLEVIEKKRITQRTQLKKEVKNPLTFQSRNEKVLFNYWNSLGYPFVRHRPIKNKTTTRGILLLSKAIRKDGEGKIIHAMNVAKEIFSSPWFKHTHTMDARKITLPDFFKYNSAVYSFVNKKYNFPISWYNECLKGVDHMKEKYNLELKDKYPDITEQLEVIWKEYTKEKKLTIEEKNILKKVSEKLIRFCKLNKHNIFTSDHIGWTLDRINDMLNNFHTYAPEELYYLRSNNFWNKKLPKEADRFNPNLVDKRDWIRLS